MKKILIGVIQDMGDLLKTYRQLGESAFRWVDYERCNPEGKVYYYPDGTHGVAYLTFQAKIVGGQCGSWNYISGLSTHEVPASDEIEEISVGMYTYKADWLEKIEVSLPEAIPELDGFCTLCNEPMYNPYFHLRLGEKVYCFAKVE